ncbi:hypothetical protein CPAR01_06147 [Colletotrichum paranaense]|uniref:Uncharacterized protein n=2 Tax=Colletotrichum acutatum species complex TaxID=2707335 RepID=A0AAI9ULB4_9PEZI|nr:uncharacterized protein CPAR01_06147 [Colletotrichum paranaense]KAK1459211.1 hypothetical protein CMEL01_02210 [Colletotrichum melonis]KAK1542760.1 hypothetical protein CPAR01_06147 [Colletotrichum paranaense]
MSSLQLMVQAASQQQEGSMGGYGELPHRKGDGRGKKRPVNKSLLNTGRVTSTHHLYTRVQSVSCGLLDHGRHEAL